MRRNNEINTVKPKVIPLLAVLCGVGACQSPGAADERGGADGVIVFGALSAPAAVRCVRLHFAGSRDMTVDVVPDGTSETRVEGLPTGHVILTGAAYGAACGSESAWVADPVELLLSAGIPVPAHLTFRRNGIAIVSADFDDLSVFSTGDTQSTIDLGAATFPMFSTAMTIEAWVFVRAHQLPAWTSIFNKWAAGGEDKWLALDGTGAATFGAWKGDTDDYIRATAATPLTTSQWHHLAGVFDGAEARIYVDGALAGSELDAGAIANDVGRAYIGAHPVRPYRGIDGGIAEVRVSSAAKYSAAFAPAVHLAAEPDTVGLWRLDQGPVTTAVDLSGHGIDGVVSASATWTEFPSRP